MLPRLSRPAGAFLAGLVFAAGATAAPPPAEKVPTQRISGIYSPKNTVVLEAGDLIRLMRVPEVLPSIPFTLLAQANDIVEVTLADGAIIREGPNTLVEYVPQAKQAAVMAGSVLVRFTKEGGVHINVPDVKGRDEAVAMIMCSKEGVKVIAVVGRLEFRDKEVDQGEMYFFNGRDMQGPFMIDLATLLKTSPIAIEFPYNRWVRASTEGAIEKQKWMKDLGLIEPSQTMLEAGGTRVKSVIPPPPASRNVNPQTETQRQNKSE